MVVGISGCPTESGVATMPSDRTLVKRFVSILKWLSATVLLFGDCWRVACMEPFICSKINICSFLSFMSESSLMNSYSLRKLSELLN